MLLEQSPACHWIVGADRAFARIWGDPSPIFDKSAAGLVGLTAAQALGTQAANTWQDRFARALAGEQVTLREHYGDSSWHITVFPIRVHSAIRFAGGLAHEITRWATAEQQLRYTVLSALKQQEFERAMASKFLHDAVGQNLTALGLQLDLIRMDLEGVSADSCARILEVQKLLETMMEEVRE